MKLENKKYTTKGNDVINYYENKSDKQKIILIHAQSTSSESFFKVAKKLSRKFCVILIDCYGHGKSSHNKEKYTISNIGNDIIEFINEEIKEDVIVLGHSSGGLIAAYIASKCIKCKKLILEDPPFFSSVGDRRFNTFNYQDLAKICHNFINQNEEKDFVTYYFMNQYAWNFFPKESVDKVRTSLGKLACNYRKKNPDKILKVPFWPKKALEVFRGMNNYDPYFGENFYNDKFNENINYEQLLKNIKCETMIMKANTTIAENGFLQGAMSDNDLERVKNLIKDSTVKYFDCGHGIHTEKEKEFIKSIIGTNNN